MASLLVEEEEGHEKCLKIIKIEIVIEQVLACPFHMGGTGISGRFQTDVTPALLEATVCWKR